MCERDPVLVPDAVAGGGPFPDTIEREKRRVLKGRREERAGRVCFVMLGERDGLGIFASQATSDLSRKVQFLLQPLRHGMDERAVATGRVGEVGLKQPLELQERLVVEPDVVEVSGAEPSLVQAVVDGLDGKPGVVLGAREPLLLRRGHNATVDQDRGRRVVVER